MPVTRRRWFVLLAVVALTAAAGVVVVLRSGADGRPWSVDAVEELPSNRLRVDYGLPTPCEHVKRIGVTESDAEVALTLVISDDGGECTANIKFESRTVQLGRPLGGRSVIDRGCIERRADQCDEVIVKRL